MLLTQAKSFVGDFVCLSYRDRSGESHEKLAEVYDVGFVPLYGPCLITDIGEVRLDRIVACRRIESSRVAA